MTRLQADVRISLKKRRQPTVRIELVRQPIGQRFWVRRDGKRSEKVPEASATDRLSYRNAPSKHLYFRVD